mgnify:CR=1 FL=1
MEVKKRRAVAARCHELEALNSEANGDPKLLARVATLRKQIGAIVRECVSHVTSGACIRAWHGIARRPARRSLSPPHPLGTARLEASLCTSVPSSDAVCPSRAVCAHCGAQAVYAAEQDGAAAGPAARGGRDERGVPEAVRARAAKAGRGPGGAGARGQGDRGGRRRDVSPLVIPPPAHAGLAAYICVSAGARLRGHSLRPGKWRLLGWRLLGWPSRCRIATSPSTHPPPPSPPSPCGSAAAEEMAEAREKELQAQIATMEAAEAARVEAELAEEDDMPDAPPGPSIMVARVRLSRATPPTPPVSVAYVSPPPSSADR